MSKLHPDTNSCEDIFFSNDFCGETVALLFLFLLDSRNFIKFNLFSLSRTVDGICLLARFVVVNTDGWIDGVVVDVTGDLSGICWAFVRENADDDGGRDNNDFNFAFRSSASLSTLSLS